MPPPPPPLGAVAESPRVIARPSVHVANPVAFDTWLAQAPYDIPARYVHALQAAFQAGYACAGGGGAVADHTPSLAEWERLPAQGDDPVPPSPAVPVFTKTGQAARTIAAALTFFRDQFLLAAHVEEVESCEWCGQAEVDVLIAEFSARGVEYL